MGCLAAIGFFLFCIWIVGGFLVGIWQALVVYWIPDRPDYTIERPSFSGHIGNWCKLESFRVATDMPTVTGRALIVDQDSKRIHSLNNTLPKGLSAANPEEVQFVVLVKNRLVQTWENDFGIGSGAIPVYSRNWALTFLDVRSNLLLATNQVEGESLPPGKRARLVMAVGSKRLHVRVDDNRIAGAYPIATNIDGIMGTTIGEAKGVPIRVGGIVCASPRNAARQSIEEFFSRLGVRYYDPGLFRGFVHGITSPIRFFSSKYDFVQRRDRTSMYSCGLYFGAGVLLVFFLRLARCCRPKTVTPTTV
jgi:hypothetical protein